MNAGQTTHPEAVKPHLHGVGVRIMCRWLVQRGYVVESAAQGTAHNPQIVATRDQRVLHVAVRTDFLPRRGALEDEQEEAELIQWARSHGAECWLASVGLAGSGQEGAAGLTQPYLVGFLRLDA